MVIAISCKIEVLTKTFKLIPCMTIFGGCMALNDPFKGLGSDFLICCLNYHQDL